MQKKIIFTFIALLFISVSYKGQRHEIGVQLGMSNLVGDIGRTNYVLQKPMGHNIADYGLPFYGSILYRMNFNPYQTVRLNLGYNHIQFADVYAKEKYRKDRKLWGTNSIVEADLIFEYNFFPVNDEQKSLLSPYVFGGVGALLANTPQLVVENDFNRDAGGNPIPPVVGDLDSFETTATYTSGKKLSMAIPFGVGLKYKFNYNWALFGEFMFRPTFSDSIDYSVIDDSSVKIKYNKDIPAEGSKSKSLLQESPYKEMAEAKAAEFVKNRQVGNINSKDWVNSVSIGLSYSFGRPPCYCD
ncbi:hypothetical protein EIB73_11680 [Kaistella carnis]|uniref:DUF6089 domain-containing protein n=2 Tax=Kaistella carnis TaxID=1241979 RepID=A0A3G8XRZ0_9FLAO|nr:hypothetical protein EIB73_11680 [Kaistella carnis]